MATFGRVRGGEVVRLVNHLSCFLVDPVEFETLKETIQSPGNEAAFLEKRNEEE